MLRHLSSGAAGRSSRVAAAPSRRIPLDGVGVAISCACACHCLALPFAAAVLPTLGLSALLGERVESALLVTAVGVGTVSLGPVARRTVAAAGWWRAPALFLVGIALLLGARLLEQSGREHPGNAAVLVGATLLVAAHLTNRRRASDAGCAADGSSVQCCACAGGDERE